MPAIGNRLREAREKKAISLDEVHAKIKIHPRIIQILEEEKFEKLPSPLFAKSFLKNYAEFLEVDPEEILEAYDKQDKKDAPDQVLYIKTADERIREARGFRNLSSMLPLVLATLLGAAALFYVFNNFRNWTGDLSKKVVSPQAAASKTKTARTVPAQVTPRGAGEWLRSPEAGDFPKLNPKDPLDLKVKALDDVWIHVTCDGKVLFQSILKKGSSENWSAAKSIRVWTGNASNMSWVLNNISLGSPGKGSVKKLAITHEGVKAIS